MCDDCGPARLSRRALVAAPAAASLAPLLPLTPAYADEWRTRQICRAAWGADPASGPFLRHTIERLTVHHSGVEFRDNRRAPATVRAIQADHGRAGGRTSPTTWWWTGTVTSTAAAPSARSRAPRRRTTRQAT